MIATAPNLTATPALPAFDWESAASPPPSPRDVLTLLMCFHEHLDHMARQLSFTVPELQAYLVSPFFQNYLQLVETIERIHQQRLVSVEISKNTPFALDTLRRLTLSDKPEVARRAATTLLTIAGLIPGKVPAPKPWDKTTITKQHMPTYSNSTPEVNPQIVKPQIVKPTDTVKPAASGGMGHWTPNSTEPPIHTEPIPDSPAFSVPRSSFPLQFHQPMANDQGLMTNDSFITKQLMPTYSNSPTTPRRSRNDHVLQEAVSRSCPQ